MIDILFHEISYRYKKCKITCRQVNLFGIYPDCLSVERPI